LLAGEEDCLAIPEVQAGIGVRIDGLAREVKRRMRIRLDFDRQKVVPFGTSQEIHDLIEEEVQKLKSPEGELEFIAGTFGKPRCPMPRYREIPHRVVGLTGDEGRLKDSRDAISVDILVCYATFSHHSTTVR